MARLMIVDDSLFQRKSLAKIVSCVGWEVAGEASNGREAIDMYERTRPDAVLMDLVMPEMEGIEAVRRILSFDKNARIVVISSLGYDQVVDEALSIGAKEFLTKPVQFSDTVACIRKVLSA